MESLERAFPRVAVAAVPSVAIPLVVDGCVDTVADVAWVREVMHLHEPAPHERALDLSAVHRQVASWFKADDLRQLISPHGTATEQIGLDWLAKDGKRWRPFLVVCTYQALAGSRNGDLPDSIRKIAIAVECIHKASLIYDDIQDNDACRYGDATVHQTHGVPVAMTAALYLLGQGYRLIAESGAPTDQTNRMLALATAGHCELCLGQGAELGWMRQPSALSSAQVLDIFRQKTAPSFEVIFGLGAIGAAAGDDVQRILRQYSQAVGVAYQIQDDLSDFTETGDVDDLAMHRPSIMLALTYEHAAPAEQKRISTLWSPNGSVISAGELRDLIRQHRVEAKTRALLDTYKEQALGALVPLTNSDLKAVLCRVVAKIFRGN
jgi:geranylgeranyl pyrophosphate synthase